jgi:hypothetical protein
MSVINTKKASLVSPSSSLLDIHLAELEEECTRLLSIIAALRSIAEKLEAAGENERETLEGDLYASLSHFKNHVEPAMEEMDRLLDEMPDDEDEETE